MQMMMDAQLKQLLRDSDPPISGVNLNCDLDSISSQIQPCSIDLRIDEIFLPMKDPNADVNSISRTRQHALKVGESVKVSTIEEFNLQKNFGAILFAPARLSRRGIVVPDIGHIDPGFSGPVRLTLINMGRDVYELKHDDTVATVLLFKLDVGCAVGLGERQGTQPYAGGLSDIRHLAPDFLHISKTAEKIVKSEANRLLGASGWRYSFICLFLPAVIGFLVAFAGYYLQTGRGFESFQNHTESRLDSLEKATAFQKESQEVRQELQLLQSSSKQTQAEIAAQLAKMQQQVDQFTKANQQHAKN